MAAMTKADGVRYVREWVQTPVSEVLALLDRRGGDPAQVARELLESRPALDRKRDEYAAWLAGRPRAPEPSIVELLREISGLSDGPWVPPPQVGAVLDEDPDAAWRLAALIGREDEHLTPWERAWASG